ncbi:hypothetical protein Drorol1_Dr00007024 [Drosera rotundifolia]
MMLTVKAGEPRSSRETTMGLLRTLTSFVVRIKLPSGAKKIVPSGHRCMIGQVAGGGRSEKPLLKAGNGYHEFRVKRNCWPKVRGVAMNLVEHPHGSGNHQHIGMPALFVVMLHMGRRLVSLLLEGRVIFVDKLLLLLLRLIKLKLA